MPRFHCPVPLATGDTLVLPAGAARHVQVLRLQPGDNITLFNGGQTGQGGEFEAIVTRMGRSDVEVTVGAYNPVERNAARRVHLVVGMPANDRMDWLVEKATELGVASIQPLMTERSVLRLSGERAEKKQAHWQSVAVAACEQCGLNRVPVVHTVLTLAQWVKTQTPVASVRLLLSLREGSQGLQTAIATSAADTESFTSSVTFLSGPEGGLSEAEELLAIQNGFAPVSLGSRVLRSETAALAALTLMGQMA